jgi:hypothetical protein
VENVLNHTLILTVPIFWGVFTKFLKNILASSWLSLPSLYPTMYLNERTHLPPDRSSFQFILESFTKVCQFWLKLDKSSAFLMWRPRRLVLILPILYFYETWYRLPLWSNGQSSRLQIQRSMFDSWHYQIFWEVVGLELGLLSLMSTTEELLERKSSSSGLENWEYDCRDLLCWPHDNPLSTKVGTNFSDKQLSLSIVCSWTEAAELLFIMKFDISW